MKKTTLNFRGSNSSMGGTFEFDVWNGRPQKPRNVLETSTRLGAKSLIVQKLRSESIPVTSDAIIIKESTVECEQFLENLMDQIGKRGTWTDESETPVENYVLLDVSYKIKAVNMREYIVQMQILGAIDGGE